MTDIFKKYRLDRRIRLFRRYREIIEVLIKYGFGEILARMNIAGRLGIGKRRLQEQPGEIIARSFAERIRLALEELGPTFIKLGQVLSTRPFLIPVDLVLELSKLQDEVAPFEFEEVRRIIRKELKADIHDIFLKLDEKPVASASLSQVHAGVLKDGRRVAVKVQRPNVRKVMSQDMEILRDLAGLLERFVPEARRYDPRGQVNELAKVSRRECDFKYEARNMDIFRINFAGVETVKIPEVIWEHTTSRILVCEYIDGIKVSCVDKLRQSGIDPGRISRDGLRVVLKMIFEDRFFHADPHPGNIFITADGRIALLDFGMVGLISESVVSFLMSLLHAIAGWDARRVIKAAADFNLVPETVNHLELETDLTELLYRYQKIPLWQVDMKALSTDAMEVFYRHNIILPGAFMLLLKALITAEEVARMLDPSINMVEEITPFVKKMASPQFRTSALKHELAATASDIRELLTTFPNDVRLITRKMRRGEIEVQFRHRGLEDLTSEIYQSSKRVSLALIIAAILVSASLLNVADLGLNIAGMPVLSLFGFLLGGALTAWLIINILRSARNR